MKKLLTTTALTLALLASTASFAGTASKSFNSTSSNKSFSSYTAPRTAPPALPKAAAVTAPATTVINKTTVVHNDNSSGGSNGFVTGMVLGSAMSHSNAPTTVVVAPAQTQSAVVQAAPAAVDGTSSDWSLWYTFGFFGFIALAWYAISSSRKEDPKPTYVEPVANDKEESVAKDKAA